jgi:hypothetical protein
LIHLGRVREARERVDRVEALQGELPEGERRTLAETAFKAGDERWAMALTH